MPFTSVGPRGSTLSTTEAVPEIASDAFPGKSQDSVCRKMLLRKIRVTSLVKPGVVGRICGHVAYVINSEQSEAG
jgi:hypothetical protein